MNNPNEKLCVFCNRPNRAVAKFCQFCGKEIINTSESEIEKIFSKFDSLIGLKNVKTEFRNIAYAMQLKKERASIGLQSSDLSPHFVFTGNPGTGKTTVARLLGELLHSLGVIQKSDVVETSRSELVAGFVGQTAIKVQEVCDKAMGGILFIDEAYTLAPKNGNDFGQEAIDTLMKRMEDDRGKFVVVAAGYKNEMESFLEANPGVKSRFTDYIHLEDYNERELLEIFKLYARTNQYILDSFAEKKLCNVISNIVQRKEKNFANARTIRNLFDKSVKNLSVRVAKIPKENHSIQLLTTIISEDINL